MYVIAALQMMNGAQANPVIRQVCGRYSVDYIDVHSVMGELDDDYFLDNAPKPARGARIVLVDNTVPMSMQIFLPWDATSACTFITVNDAHTYNVKMYSVAHVNNNTINVKDDSGNIFVHQGPHGWDPSNGGLTLTTGTADQWNVAASAGFAMYRRAAGVSGETVDIVISGACGGSCYTGGPAWDPPLTPTILVSSGHAARKYVPAHEIGHFLGDALNAYRWQETGGLAVDTANCVETDGQLIHKNYASDGAIEGIAWYYAAVAFNQTDQSDCEIAEAADFDLGGGPPDPNTGETAPSCQGEASESWSEVDFLANHCGGTLPGRATQLDWMRAFWDADNGEGLSTTQIFNMYAEARPDDWDETPVGGNATDPDVRFETAASTLGIDVEWNAVDDVNGVR